MTQLHLLSRFLDRSRLLGFVNDMIPAVQNAFGLHLQLENYRFRKQWPADKPALPPPRLIYLVTGQLKIERFLTQGQLGVKCIRRILSRNGLDIESFRSILDFGCGCGRIMRHWANLPHAQFYGTDYNPSLIEWCRRALPFAKFSVNPLNGPFSYEEDQFDFVYSISVLTHLTVADQQAWMNELLRVMKPGGHLYLTLHGMMRDHMTAEQQKLFEAGHPVVFGERYAGSNACGAYFPESYVRNVLAKDFNIVDFVPRGAEDAGQDVYLLQKPPQGPSS